MNGLVISDQSANKAKGILMCKQLGLNTAKFTDEEWRVLMKALDNSAPVRKVKKRKSAFEIKGTCSIDYKGEIIDAYYPSRTN